MKPNTNALWGYRCPKCKSFGPFVMTVETRMTVEVSDAFGDLTPEALRLAVAQIVATASEIDGVEAVQLRIDGTARVWPLGSGELTDRPLTVYDYPGLIESTQPAFPAIPTPVA